MKKLLLFFVTLSMAVFASAQQLPDPGFEDWSGAKFANAEQPKYWNFSNVSQMGVDKNFAHKTTGRSGSALKIQDQRVGVDSIGTTSPGYVSLGKTWAFTSSDTAIEDATAGTYGGVQWKYRPDSMVVWIKRYYDSSAEGADGDHVMDEDFNILYYAWSGTAQGATYKAKNGSCTNVYSAKPEYCIDEESDIRQALNGNECGTKTYAKQIAEGWICDRKVYSDWTRIVVPIYYLNDDVPEKCNVILSAGNYPNFRANTGQYAGSTMDVDDISLVYTSKIQKLYINGREWKEFNPNSTEEQTYSLGLGVTEIPDIYAVRGAGSLTNLRNETVNFPGRRLSNTECKVVKGQVDGEPTTITVTSEDGKSTTTYKIKFKSRNTKLADLKVNGTPVHGFNVHLNTFHYNVALPYGTTTIPTVTATAQDANATISITQANSVTGKAIVLVTAADGTQQTYTITFFVVALKDVMLYVDGIGALDMNQGPNFTLNFPYGTKELNVSVVKKYEDQEVTILNNGVNEPTTITVKSFNPAEEDKVYTITPKVIDYPDYSLTSVTVNGAPLANFNPNILTYIIPVTTTKPVLKYQHTGIVGVSATAVQDNNKYTQVEVIDEYDNTRHYTFYYYYKNDVIPNGDFTEYRAGLKNTMHTQMPVGWYGYADQYNEYSSVFWKVDNPGREIFKLKDGVLGISWGYWPALESSSPLVLTLGNTDGFVYKVNKGSSASFSGGIPFRNTPDAADITYQLVDDEGLKSKFSFVFTDEQGTQTYDYIASELTSNYTTHRLPLATANKVTTQLNINIDASNGHKAGTDAGCWTSNYCDYGDVIYIDRIGFVYNSTLTELTVDGQTATLTDKNFAVDFSDSEMVLPALTFKGEVPDQMPVVTWSNAWTKSGAKATRTATIVNYAEDLSSTTYTLTVTRPTSTNANCTYTLNGNDLIVTKESPYQTIDIATNDSAYLITVTAENGETKIIELPYNKACVPYTYSILTSDSTLGSVTITQELTTCTEPLIFRADAAEGYQFTQWSDGNTDNPRSLVLTQDTTITAEFELAQCLIASGYCGADSTNLTWELSCDSVLTISGTGAMADYAYNTVPWYDYRSSILSVVISDSVTSIGDRAFTNCSSLTSVTIPNSVTSIGNYTFYGCSSLTSVTIGNSVTSIGNQAFYLCSSLTSITIPNSVTSIGNSAFYGCSSLTSVTIPNSVTSIGNSTFYDCSSLTSITIPNSVTSIGMHAFSRCSSLTSVTIPNSVTSIGNNAFDLCSSLTSVTIPNSVTSIGNTAFLRCSSLKSMIVESGNTVYDSRENCNAIIETATNTLIVGCQNTIIPNSVTSIGNSAFYGCSSLTSVTIPNSVTSIGNSVFRGCSSLTSITIPNSVTSIGSYTFYDCSSLTSVTIPNSVTSIGNSAFYDCSSLTSVTFESITPPTIRNDAYDNTNNCPIYVPCGTKDAYVAALNENNTIDESRVIEKLPYTYSILTSDSTLGFVTITQEPTCTEPIFFRADAAEGYQFTQWSDGNTDNPRSLILTQDTTLTALFEQIVIEQDTIIVADSTGISDIIPDGQDTIPYVEVQPDGEITIDITDVRIGVITIVTIGTESGQVHPGFGGNYDELENTRVVMEYVLNPFGQTASPDKWYAFAVPFEVDIENGITRKYGNKSHVPGKDFMILEYDSELRSRTGSGWVEKKSGSLTPGHIYMLGIEGNCNRWLFEKKRGAAIVGDKEKDLQHYAQGNSKNNGWHGLGNTTLEYVDMSFSIDDILYILVYDNQHSRYITYHIDELVLAVGQPFFVQTTQEGASVVFEHNNGKGKGNGNGKKNMPIYAPSYDVQPTLPRVRFTIENENINATPDRLYITLHDDNLSGSYIIGRDLMRMDKGSKQVPNFWCPMADGTQLSAHGVTMPTTYTTIPLGIFTPAKGEYTINAHMQDMNDYIVELYYQNVCLGTFMHDMPLTLDLTAGTSYDYSIRISRRVSTDLNPAEDTQCDKDNKWYDVLGRPLPQDAHGIFIRKGEKIIK